MICTCIHCGKGFNPNPRVKNQGYCSNKRYKRARRAKWQREKMAGDPDYRDNQSRCQKQWQAAHPDYYRDYRAKHPEYVERNRLLQIRRNAKRGNKDKDGLAEMIAKMDSLNRFYPSKGKLFRLIPQDQTLIAKMDSLIVRLVPVQERVMRL